MNKRKAYVSPQVTRVKLEPTQAVLSQCVVGVGNLKAGLGTVDGFCDNVSHPNCKQAASGASNGNS